MVKCIQASIVGQLAIRYTPLSNRLVEYRLHMLQMESAFPLLPLPLAAAVQTEECAQGMIISSPDEWQDSMDEDSYLMELWTQNTDFYADDTW